MDRCTECGEIYDPEDNENDPRGQDLCYGCYVAAFYQRVNNEEKP